MRADAKRLGLVRYFTGKLCSRGHVAERLTSNGSCLTCCADKSLKHYWLNRDKELAAQKVYREKTAEVRQQKRLAARLRLDPDLAQRRQHLAAIRASRAEAIAQGKSVYMRDDPCSHGHLAGRFVDGHKCVECNRIKCAERARKRLANNPELRIKKERHKEHRRVVAIKKEKRAAKVASTRRAGSARKEAKIAGLNTYMSGRPCKHGHNAPRYTQTGSCTECASIQAASPAKKAYDLQYVAKNAERIRERTKRYQAKTSALRCAAARDWSRKNPEKRKAIAMAYKARRRAKVDAGDSTAEIFAWERQAPKVCHWCNAKCPAKYEVDHYVPLAKGGRHEVANLVIACPTCNRRKSAKDPYQFATSVGRLF